MSTVASIKKIIAVASGKGGVGKSTIAVNLALTLHRNFAVGILDADIYGPSIPQLLGLDVSEPMQYNESKQFLPKIVSGMPTMSIGYLIDPKAPAIWRGPMASKAIQQLLQATDWGVLDYLIVDLPPGTGDIHLTLAQKLALNSAIMVTTPQSLALSDVRKAIAMFQKVEVPILGIIENMSTYQCPHCHHEEALFGTGGGDLLSTEYQLPLLARLPFDLKVRVQSDQGQPMSLSGFDSPSNLAYQSIAQHLTRRLKKSARRGFPPVQVE